MERLFSYGTLKDPAVQLDVIGRRVEGKQSAIDGFVLKDMILGSEVYPVALPKVGSRIKGHVFELRVEELVSCDEYETDAYQRIQVETCEGLDVWLYINANDKAIYQ